MREYFERRRQDIEYRRAEEAVEPGFQFAMAIQDLQNRLGLDFSDFCKLVGIPERELSDILLEFRFPPPEMIAKILKATHARIEFRPDQEAAAAAI